jgi:AraC-like DNA-binding protein
MHRLPRICVWLWAALFFFVAGAIGALHRDAGQNSTVADLAAETGSSRSVFAERFHAVSGVTPLRYAAELRMRLAVP